MICVKVNNISSVLNPIYHFFVLILFNRKATFDTADHSLLEILFFSLGFWDTIHSWFSSYLTGYSFLVSFTGFSSSSWPRGCQISILTWNYLKWKWLFSLYRLYPLSSLSILLDIQTKAWSLPWFPFSSILWTASLKINLESDHFSPSPLWSL